MPPDRRQKRARPPAHPRRTCATCARRGEAPFDWVTAVKVQSILAQMLLWWVQRAAEQRLRRDAAARALDATNGTFCPPPPSSGPSSSSSSAYSAHRSSREDRAGRAARPDEAGPDESGGNINISPTIKARRSSSSVVCAYARAMQDPKNVHKKGEGVLRRGKEGKEAVWVAVGVDALLLRTVAYLPAPTHPHLSTLILFPLSLCRPFSTSPLPPFSSPTRQHYLKLPNVCRPAMPAPLTHTYNPLTICSPPPSPLPHSHPSPPFPPPLLLLSLPKNT